MQYWRVGQRNDEPCNLPVHSGPKHLLTVQILVNTADAVEAHDIVGDMLRQAETFLTHGPIIDWAFAQDTPYSLPDAYEEGDAFSDYYPHEL